MFMLVLSITLTIIAFQPEVVDFNRCVKVSLNNDEEFTISSFNYVELTEYTYERLTVSVVKEVGSSYTLLIYVSPNVTSYEVVKNKYYEVVINGSRFFHIMFRADDHVDLNICLKAVLRRYRDYLVLPITVSWVIGTSVLMYIALHQVISKVRRRFTH